MTMVSFSKGVSKGIRGWSLITGMGGGGLQNGRGEGQVMFYPYEKVGGESFSHAEGGGGQNKF